VRLLLVRHAIAVERGTEGIADEARPLTKRGTARFRTAARGIASTLRRPDLLLTSPLLRARETAEILAKAWGRTTPTTCDALAGGGVPEIAAAIGEKGSDALVVLVGHEPHLSLLLAHLLGGSRPERLAFRKGGCALVECDAGLTGGGRLLFFLPPKVLRTVS
jgi:phosphohistidine phosphatase